MFLQQQLSQVETFSNTIPPLLHSQIRMWPVSSPLISLLYFLLEICVSYLLKHLLMPVLKCPCFNLCCFLSARPSLSSVFLFTHFSWVFPVPAFAALFCKACTFFPIKPVLFLLLPIWLAGRMDKMFTLTNIVVAVVVCILIMEVHQLHLQCRPCFFQ